MTRLRFRDQDYKTAGRSVLDCLGANGQDIPHSCRSGVCQGCLMRAVSGVVPARAQQGLRDTLVSQGFFLACQCHPVQPLEVSLEGAGAQHYSVRVLGRKILVPGIVSLEITRPLNYEYRAGQVLRLFRDESTWRNYSLASVPGIEEALHVHVRHVSGGAVSGWVHERLVVGEEITISGAQGECCHVSDAPGRKLLLLGTGTGVAPLWAIARDALRNGHQGDIHLYHGSRDEAGQYLRDELEAMQSRSRNFRYHPSVAPAGGAHPGVAAVALGEIGNLAHWRVYLCGSPAMVETARMECFLAGAASGDIFADAFLPYKASGADSSPDGPGTLSPTPGRAQQAGASLESR